MYSAIPHRPPAPLLPALISFSPLVAASAPPNRPTSSKLPARVPKASSMSMSRTARVSMISIGAIPSTRAMIGSMNGG